MSMIVFVVVVKGTSRVVTFKFIKNIPPVRVKLGY